MRKVLLIALCLAAALQSLAASVDAATARAKAYQFMMGNPTGKFMSPAVEMKLIHAEASSVNKSLNDFYVFNLSDGNGFVIVSGDDRAEEILAYGDSAIDDYQNMPDNMRWYLGHFKEQIEYLHANPMERVTRESDMLKGSFKASSVSPLLGSNDWGQSAPFYNQTPMSGSKHTVTGCVATSLAMVMWYWKYPTTLPPLPAYTTKSTNINVPALPGVTVDWNNMPEKYNNGYTTAQGNAVASLMRYCGQACLANYGTSASSASNFNELTAIRAFGYNLGATMESRSGYETSEWNAMLQEELEAARPVLYSGTDIDAYVAHSFVVDGYNASTAQYHINWGWNGRYNCYCSMDAFNANGYKFNTDMNIMYHVFPFDKQDPVIGDATDVGTTSFTANWTDRTPADNVVDYTLYADACEPGMPESLLVETFSGASNYGDGSYINIDMSISLNPYCDNAGWTGRGVRLIPNLAIYHDSNPCYITSPAVDLSNSGGIVTVKFKASAYNTSVVVSCGNVQQTVALTGNKDYTVVLEGCAATANQHVTMTNTSTSNSIYMYNFEILSGDASSMPGHGEDSRVITGITSQNYTVAGLTPGKTYKCRVVANYTDGTIRASQKGTVTLLEPDVNNDGMLTPADISALIDLLLNGTVVYQDCADVDGNGVINPADLSALIDLLLNE